jgi:hypothetical protein
MVKTVRSTLKKALKGNSNAKIDIIAAEWGLNKKIEAIRNLLSQDNDFSVEYINFYYDFITLFLRLSFLFPDHLKKTLATSEQEIHDWENDLSVVKAYPKEVYK